MATSMEPDRTWAVGSEGALASALFVRGAIDDDRDRIARNLNETVIQRLFATGLMLQACAGRVDTAERIARAVSGIDDAIRELRWSIYPCTPQAAA